MFDVLVYLLDEKYREEIAEIFSAPSFQLHLATELPAVLDICQREMIELLLIWPGDFQTVSALLQHLENHQLKHQPVIAVVRKSDEFHEVSTLPLAGVIPIPIPKTEFYQLVNQVLAPLRKAMGLTTEAAVSDETFLESGFIETIRRIRSAQADALLLINDRGHIGRIYFRQGKIIRATFRALEGIPALRKLVGLNQADLKVHFTEVKEEGNLENEYPLLAAELEKQLVEQNKMIRKLSPSPAHFRTHPKLQELKYPQNDISSQIIELCREGSDLYDLLRVMNQDNLEILQSVKELSEKGVLVSVKEKASAAEIQPNDKKSVLRIVNLLSRFVKKSKKSVKERPVVSGEKKIEIAEQFAPKIAVTNPHLPADIDPESGMKIEKFIREIYS